MRLSPFEDNESELRPRCFLAIPFSNMPLRYAVKEGVAGAGFRAILLDEEPILAISLQEKLVEEISLADCVVADLSSRNPNIFYELGIAQAMGKGLFLLVEKGAEADIPADLRGLQVLHYQTTSKGLSDLAERLTLSLDRYRRFPRRQVSLVSTTSSFRFMVDWDRLERPEAENLCRELLAQMGYQAVKWVQSSREVDLVAELPRKDPDGFEYHETWLVSMGRNAPIDRLISFAVEDPYSFARGIIADDMQVAKLVNRSMSETSITILFILLAESLHAEEWSSMLRRFSERNRKRQGFNFRIRIWERDYLTSLVQQFPQIGYKYFSDEERARAKYRKSPDELYRENVAMAERQAELIQELTEERDRRVRAERDAVWKDISFSAAHKVGNPIFAIETNLEPLRRRINRERVQESLEIVDRIGASVEKAKGIVDQFKSLTRAQEICPVSFLLFNILEETCKTARSQGVECDIDCPDTLRIYGDPERLSECFDELAANAVHWFDKSFRRIEIRVEQPAPLPLPAALGEGENFTLVHFRDNGRGIELGSKERIFDAFYTTHEHGTGLGLALVRRIIEGHGGVVFESGAPGEGAEFQIYLPSEALTKSSPVPTFPSRRVVKRSR